MRVRCRSGRAPPAPRPKKPIPCPVSSLHHRDTPGSPALEVHDDLIFDLGANQGEDSEFYLAKGFRVVAVEANPLLYAGLRERLAEPIARGQLVLLNLGIWAE